MSALLSKMPSASSSLSSSLSSLYPTVSSSSSSSASASTPTLLKTFSTARGVFDYCDHLRHEYHECIVRGRTEIAEQCRQDMERELSGLGLLVGQGKEEEEEHEGAGKKRQWGYVKADANSESNRWSNVRPYDDAMLPEPYLNASGIPPMIFPNASQAVLTQSFIASQAPLPSTFPNFWHHLLSSGTRLIVNLTPVFDMQGSMKLRKSHEYWPTTQPNQKGKAKLQAGSGWTVELISEEEHSTAEAAGSVSPSGHGNDWIILKRHLRVLPPSDWIMASASSYTESLFSSGSSGASKSNGSAGKTTSPSITQPEKDADGGYRVTMLHIDSWADGGISSSANFSRLVELVEATQRSLQPSSSSSSSSTSPTPIWVHCSAGIGRTGTLIAGLIARSLVETKDATILATPSDKVVVEIWNYLRQRRFGMITTQGQAMMVYDEVERVKKTQTVSSQA